MLVDMFTPMRIVLLALLMAAPTLTVAARAAAQETEYDPQGRRIPPAAVPDGYVGADDAPPAATPPAATAPAAIPPAATPPSGIAPPGAPPADAIPPPPPAPDTPPSPYRVEADDTPRYPRAAPSEQLDDTTDAGVRLPSRISARLRALDRDYTALSMRGSNGLVDGILSIVTGGLSIALGAVLPDSANGFATYFYVFGAGNIAHGLVDLFITPDPVEPALIFAHMPMGTVDEVKARLRFGEQSLETLADRSRLGRILEGSLDIATGVAFIPFYLGPRDYAFTGDILDIVVMTAALIRVISGVATLIMRTDAERRWSAYATLRDDLRERHRQRSRVRADIGAAPLPGGGAVTLVGTF